MFRLYWDNGKENRRISHIFVVKGQGGCNRVLRNHDSDQVTLASQINPVGYTLDGEEVGAESSACQTLLAFQLRHNHSIVVSILFSNIIPL